MIRTKDLDSQSALLDAHDQCIDAKTPGLIILDSGSQVHLSSSATITDASRKVALVPYDGHAMDSTLGTGILQATLTTFDGSLQPVTFHNVHKIAEDRLNSDILSMGLLLQDGFSL